jgi:uncharacterized protein YdeI (YjbR/CyaY-like superfamily)
MVEVTETLYAKDRKFWRDWLGRHHAEKKEIWLVFYKKHVQEPCVTYDQAVEEALCFGWIDSTLKRNDDNRHTIRFTPRKNTRLWSNLNRKRFRKMIGQGRMTKAGLDKVHPSVDINRDDALTGPGEGLAIPEFVQEGLKAEPEAWAEFQARAPSQQRMIVGWIMNAKRPETHIRRLERAIKAMHRKEPVGMGWKMED